MKRLSLCGVCLFLSFYFQTVNATVVPDLLFTKGDLARMRRTKVDLDSLFQDKIIPDRFDVNFFERILKQVPRSHLSESLVEEIASRIPNEYARASFLFFYKHALLYPRIKKIKFPLPEFTKRSTDFPLSVLKFSQQSAVNKLKLFHSAMSEFSSNRSGDGNFVDFDAIGKFGSNSTSNLLSGLLGFADMLGRGNAEEICDYLREKIRGQDFFSEKSLINTDGILNDSTMLFELPLYTFPEYDIYTLSFNLAVEFFKYLFVSDQDGKERIYEIIADKEQHAFLKVLLSFTWKILSSIGWKAWNEETLRLLKEGYDAGKRITYFAGGTDIYNLLRIGIYNFRMVDPLLSAQHRFYSDIWYVLVTPKLKGFENDVMKLGFSIDGDEITLVRDLENSAHCDIEPESCLGGKLFWDVFKNGKKAREYTYDKGWFQGVYNEYYPSGKIYESINFKNNDYVGDKITYFPNGKIKRKISYNNGVAEGIAEEYNISGKLIKSTEYLQGYRHGPEKIFDKNGNLKHQYIYYYD